VPVGGRQRRLFREPVGLPALTDETPEHADFANSKGMTAMADDLLIAMIIAGFGLSGAYFRAVFVSWRRNQAAEWKREISLRELYGRGLCRNANEVAGSSTVQAETSVEAKAATLVAITDGEPAPAVDRVSKCSERQNDRGRFI
jgi:hypothetical protein